MKKSEIKETHTRACRVVIDRRELEKLLVDHALTVVGFAPFATSAEVRLTDATEGNPPYKVGTYCTVDLIEDQKAFATDATRQEAPDA